MARAYRLLIRVIEIALGALLGLLAAIVPLGVVFRYVLNNALSWTDEIGGFTLVWITFLGSVIALDRGVHLDMDLLSPHVGPRVRTALCGQFEQPTWGSLPGVESWKIKRPNCRCQ